MLVRSLIETNVPTLNQDSTLTKAWSVLHELDWDICPVIDQESGQIVGMVRQQIIEREANQPSATLHDVMWEEPVVIYNRQHIFEAVRLMLQHEIRVLPVVNDEMEYEGVIQKSALLNALTEMLNLAEYGSIITIELGERDFTLSEIVNLIESEGGKILGLTVETPTGVQDNIRVSVKLNVKEISRIVATLRRYDYLVSTETRDETMDADMRTRASELMHYLDI
jgi:CBS domain-containing protein